MRLRLTSAFVFRFACCQKFMMRSTWHVQERHIDELFVVRFSPDGKTLFVGGKRKSRTRWDPQDEDNAILHCHIKVCAKS